jgi:hypothetical protein
MLSGPSPTIFTLLASNLVVAGPSLSSILATLTAVTAKVTQTNANEAAVRHRRANSICSGRTSPNSALPVSFSPIPSAAARTAAGARTGVEEAGSW